MTEEAEQQDKQDDHHDLVRNRVQAITESVLDYVEDIMRAGSPRQKSDLIRQVFPVLVKALAPDESDRELEQLRAEMANLMAEVRDTVPTGDTHADHAPTGPIEDSGPQLGHGGALGPQLGAG